MKNVCVGVTGLDVSDHPMSGLGIARCLKLHRDIRLIGLTYNALSSGCYARDVFDEIHLINDPLRKGHKFFEDIVRLKEKNGLRVVIPSIPWEIPVYAESRNRFKQKKIGILLPKKENIVSTFDQRVTNYASISRIRIPLYVFVQDKRELAERVAALRFPIIIKSSAENCVAYNITEARVFTDRLFDYGDVTLCIQEYVTGEEYSVAALADENHKLSGIVIVKKLVLTGQGTPWIVVSVYDKELASFTEGLVQYLKWVGPLELTLIREALCGTYSLIKFHPCFPSWIYLAPRVGQNLPLKVVKMTMGETTRGNTKYNTGIMYVRNAEDVVCDMRTVSTLTTSGRLIYHV
ncbi:MAG: hypothetical protein A3E19_07075 [Planctomycetes bacterium RIFCSPHIGHO2_12_FULL_52_36]|nr:MAG: hypothetical protein A3D89_02190 [Planctomycetes bacterium RIFCSPHIGHO2_02_FULL_52_58]OHB93522.1 MAG: hypothetical protein A3E19_07075 [Planctomycetes bacterium RIFCSPHIGHO2_12_FULL_52_36]